MNYRHLYSLWYILVTLTMTPAASLTDVEHAQVVAIQQRQIEQIRKFRAQTVPIITQIDPETPPRDLRTLQDRIVLKCKCLSALSKLDQLKPEGIPILLSMLLLLVKSGVDLTAPYDDRNDPVEQSLKIVLHLSGIEER